MNATLACPLRWLTIHTFVPATSWCVVCVGREIVPPGWRKLRLGRETVKGACNLLGLHVRPPGPRPVYAFAPLEKSLVDLDYILSGCVAQGSLGAMRSLVICEQMSRSCRP